MRFKHLFGGVALCALTGLAAPAFAQQAPNGDADAANPGEIVVVARKRAEAVFDVPSPVTVTQGTQIDALRLRDARDLISLTPTAFLQEGNAGTARDISVRGVSTPNLFAEPGVAFYVDEVYSSGFISYPMQFYDIERVEVLRGPQGALYGRNAVGGAVNVISRRPTQDLSVDLEATYASLERSEALVVVNAPLGERIGVRAVGWWTDQDRGEYFNPATNRYLDANSSHGGRLVAAFDPTEAISLTLTAEHAGGTTPGTMLFFPDAGETPHNVRRDTQPVNHYDANRYTLNAQVRGGSGEVTFILGRRDYNLDGLEDTDLSDEAAFGSPLAPIGQQVLTRSNATDSTFSELRWLSPAMGRLTVLAGINYLNETASGDILNDLPGVSIAFSGGTLPATLFIDNNQEVTSWSEFVEATIRVSDHVSLIASGRYTRDEKSVDFVFTPSALLTGLVGPAQTASPSATFDNVSPGLTLAYAPSETVNVYARVQTGFRAGGFNFNVANAANLPYDEETSINYELGAKLRSADRRAYLSLTAFRLDQDHVLVPLFDFTAPPGLQAYLGNVAKASTVGLEAEGSLRVSDGLTLGASLGWLDAEFTSGAVNGVSVSGNELPSARKLTGSLTMAYERVLSGDLTFVANGSYTHRSRGFQDSENTSRIGGNDLINASGGFEFGHFEALAFVQNALDDQYDIAFGGFRPPGASGVTRATGRTYGLTLRAHF